MQFRIILTLLSLALVVGVVFSGSLSSSAKPNSPLTMATAAHIERADTNIDWDNMSRPERKEYMRSVVMPKMKEILHNFDPKTFKEPKCVTCHGRGAQTGSFKMPNPELPKLPATPEGFAKLREKKPAMMKFMSETMKPTMADLLGMKPFDPKTGTGFGCGNCHMTKGAKKNKK